MRTPKLASMGRRPKKERDEFGAHLLELRQAAELSQQALADQLGINPENLCFWEKTGKLPGRDLIPGMAKALGVSIEELLRTEKSSREHPGPKGELERLVQEARNIPKAKKKQIANVLRALIEKARTD